MGNIEQVISQNMRFAREQLGISQAELALGLSLASHSAISDMESGKRRVTAADLVVLSTILKRPVDWFLDPQATKEDFVLLARAQDGSPELKTALAEVETYFANYLLLRRLLRIPA